MNARLERKPQLLGAIVAASMIGAIADVFAQGRVRCECGLAAFRRLSGVSCGDAAVHLSAAVCVRDLGRLPIRGRADGIDVVGIVPATPA